jgi:dienelactone hydrolase
MKTLSIFYAVLIASAISLVSVSCNDKKTKPVIKEETVIYKVDTTVLKGFVAYPADSTVKHPAVIIIHEWWGMNDYIKSRARQLAHLGYVAFAADMFGGGKIASDPKQSMEFTSPFYKDAHLALTYLNAALTEIKKYKQADVNNVAAIGYYFGGYVVLNAAKLGADLKGIVSFHGGLGGVPADKALLKAKILVCHGDSDKFVSQKAVDAFRHQMDSIKADYTYKSYPNATHAFTNPEATNLGKKFKLPIEYNAKADTASWNDMQAFFNKIFENKSR